MPFTVKEIEDFLEKDEHELFRQFAEVVEQSASYQLILGYLTGRTQSLHGLQDDDMLIIWSSLFLLLESIENPTPNDQLVLDVIMHPEMKDHGRNDLQVMLLDYVMAHPSEEAFSAVLNHFRVMGASDTDIFSFVIFRLGYSVCEKQLAPSPLKDFLSGHIKASPHLIYPYHGYLAHTNDWSIMYFKLLEEARPDLTMEYVLYGTYVDTFNNNPVQFLATYRSGHYLPSLLTFIRDMTNGKPELVPSKFRAAMLLWETDEEQFSDLVIDISRQYLACLKTRKIKQHWGDWHRLKTSGGIDVGSLEYSTCAIYFLLQVHPEEALEQVADMFRNKVFVPVRVLDLLCQKAKEAVFPLFEMALQADSHIGGIRYYQDVTELLQKHFRPAV